MAKGRMLSMEEILQMNGKYVFIEPCMEQYKNDIGKAQIVINDTDNIIGFYTQLTKNCWEASMFQNSINTGRWLDVYEWIEEDQEIEQCQIKDNKYKGYELIKILTENPNAFNNGDIFIDQNNDEFKLTIHNNKAYLHGQCYPTFINNTFRLKKVEYLTFDEARKSGKMFRHKDWGNFYIINDVLRTLTAYNSEQINELIDGLWEVE